MGRIIGVIGTLIAVAALAAPASAKVLAKSTFNTAHEGWKVVGDVATDPEKPDHIDEGGHPGGFIQVVDKAIGGVMYWRAPADYRGNQRDAYKGTINYHLTQSSAANPFDAANVIIEGGGLVLENAACCGPPSVFPVWSTYSVPLSKDDWVRRIDPSTTVPATGAQMKTALGDIDRFLIRAEYRTGDDTDGLDTVKLKTPPPAR